MHPDTHADLDIPGPIHETAELLDSDGLRAVIKMLRPYQIAWLNDTSRYRVYLKSRRIGITWVSALEMVLVASGIYAKFVTPHNCNVISRKEKHAKSVIRECKRWIRALRSDPVLAPFLTTTVWAMGAIEFEGTGYRIEAETQSPEAGRGEGGHLYRDEMAFHDYAYEIQAAAVPSIMADKRLRLTEISTPNGISGPGLLFFEICKSDQYDYYSRHVTDIWSAKDQGFEIDPEECRKTCTSQAQYEQEYECKFVESSNIYITDVLYDRSVSSKPSGTPDLVVVSADVASEVDLTGVTVTEMYGASSWLTHAYMIDKTPYKSAPGVWGQEFVLDAIIKAHGADKVITDATGDGKMIWQLVSELSGGVAVIPLNISKRWKDRWIPDLKTSMESGTFSISKSLIVKQFSPLEALRFQDEVQAISEPEEFVNASFVPHNLNWDPLKFDFMKLHKKMTAYGLTYDTHRDRHGHGDLFWSSVMGFSVCKITRAIGSSGGGSGRNTGSHAANDPGDWTSYT